MRKTNQNMGKLVTASALAIGLAAVAQSASAGISTTRHNMGNISASTNNRTGGTNQICVFCHTPHGSSTSVTAPLWNKWGTKTGTSYTSYTSTNSATFQADQSGPGSVSLACLTCHDGTQAMDNMLNGPGPGDFRTDGGGVSGMTGAAWNWSAGSNSTGVTTEGLMLGPTGTRNALLGTDLSNDHPVGMNYCASTGPTVTTITTASCNDTDFNTVTNSGNRYWVDTGTAGYQKTDFPLYSTGSVLVKVECATCHDPHDATNGTFLRKANTGSAVCLTCHVK